MTALYNEHDPFAAEWLRNLISAGELPAGRVDERSITELTGADLEGIDELHLFAGIGGWPLALRLAGWTGPVWTGSCPCQPFSSAGKRRGTDDERHLWPEMFRLIRECRPVVVFGEQVAGKAALEWLDGVSADLEGEGYAVGSVVLGAHSVGAPHIRQRLFWVGYTTGHDEQRASVAAMHREGKPAGGSGCIGGLADSRQQSPRNADAGSGIGSRDESPARRAEAVGESRRCCGSRGLGDADGRREGAIRSVRGGTGTDGEGSPWSDAITIPCRDGKFRRISAQPGDVPLAYGLPRKLGPAFAGLGSVGVRTARRNRVGRLKGYGNAIVPQLAAEFIRAFMEAGQ